MQEVSRCPGISPVHHISISTREVNFVFFQYPLAPHAIYPEASRERSGTTNCQNLSPFSYLHPVNQKNNRGERKNFRVPDMNLAGKVFPFTPHSMLKRTSFGTIFRAIGRYSQQSKYWSVHPGLIEYKKI